MGLRLPILFGYIMTREEYIDVIDRLRILVARQPRTQSVLDYFERRLKEFDSQPLDKP